MTSVTVRGPANAASPLATIADTATYQLSATVVGTNNPSPAVTWAVSPAVTGVSVSASGLVSFTGLTANAGPATIVATSVEDGTKKGSFVITQITHASPASPVDDAVMAAAPVEDVKITKAGKRKTV